MHAPCHPVHAFASQLHGSPARPDRRPWSGTPGRRDGGSATGHERPVGGKCAWPGSADRHPDRGTGILAGGPGDQAGGRAGPVLPASAIGRSMATALASAAGRAMRWRAARGDAGACVLQPCSGRIASPARAAMAAVARGQHAVGRALRALRTTSWRPALQLCQLAAPWRMTLCANGRQGSGSGRQAHACRPRCLRGLEAGGQGRECRPHQRAPSTPALASHVLSARSGGVDSCMGEAPCAACQWAWPCDSTGQRRASARRRHLRPPPCRHYHI